MGNYKQAVVLREDIEVSTGKKISQACHASLMSCEKADGDLEHLWKESGQKKVVLKSEELEELRDAAEKAGVPSALVRDAGKTEVESGTVTALGVGPAESGEVDRVTGNLEVVE